MIVLGRCCAALPVTPKALAGLAVENVDMGGVRRDVQSLSLVGGLASLDSDDEVVWSALDAAGAVHEGVGAEFFDDGDGDRETPASLVTIRQLSGRTPTVTLPRILLAASGSTGTVYSPSLTFPPDAVPRMRFICGEPMKPATKRLSVWS